MKRDYTHFNLMVSQFSFKNVNKFPYPAELLDNMLKIKKMSFSVKFPFSSRIVMFSNLMIFSLCVGQLARVFSKYVRSLCLLLAGKLMTR